MVHWSNISDKFFGTCYHVPQRWLRRHPIIHDLLAVFVAVLGVFGAAAFAYLLLSESLQTTPDGTAPSRDWRFQKPDAMIWHAHEGTDAASQYTVKPAFTLEHLHTTDSIVSSAATAALQPDAPLKLSVPPYTASPAMLPVVTQQPLYLASTAPSRALSNLLDSPGYHCQQSKGHKPPLPGMLAVQSACLWTSNMNPLTGNSTLLSHTKTLHTNASWQLYGVPVPLTHKRLDTASDTPHADRRTALAVYTSTATSQQCPADFNPLHGAMPGVLKHAPDSLLIYPFSAQPQQLLLAAVMQPFAHYEALPSDRKHINPNVLAMLSADKTMKPILQRLAINRQPVQICSMLPHTPVQMGEPADLCLQKDPALHNNSSLSASMGSGHFAHVHGTLSAAPTCGACFCTDSASVYQYKYASYHMCLSVHTYTHIHSPICIGNATHHGPMLHVKLKRCQPLQCSHLLIGPVAALTLCALRIPALLVLQLSLIPSVVVCRHCDQHGVSCWSWGNA